jgi:CrcB protein
VPPLPGWVLVGLGGFLGSVLRYGVSGLVQRLGPAGGAFPLGTLGVNALGSFLIGLLGGLADSRGLFGPGARLLIFLGLLGGFTTFSSFSYETLQLLKDGQWHLAGLNVAGQLLLGLGAVWLGWGLGRLPGVSA